MKSRIFFSVLGLVAVLLASCAPQATQFPAPLEANPPQAATQVPESTPQPQATQAPTQTAPVVAVTSRGDKLEATDPTTVSLASGGVQLVEFFRFT